MKSILLNRHAKSSWDHPQLSDFDRPLNERGKADVPMMAQRLLDKEQTVDLIISSPANRAITTANLFAKAIEFPEIKIGLEENIYLASTRALLKVVNEIDDQYNSVMLFGHNPGLTDFVDYLTGSDVGNIPTCGIVKINFNTDQWSHVSMGTGILKFFDYPKNMK